MVFPSPHPHVTAKALRLLILEQAKRAHVGHIGSALSVAEIMAAIFSGRADTPGLSEGEKDRFLLSKGHAALALYASLHLQGRLSRERLDTYCGNGTLLGVHPEKELPGVEFSSGSLGQGLCIGAGTALALKMKGSRARVRVVMSDAEMNEGSTWEAVMFAAQRKLDNLDVVVDVNGQQALGRTKDIIDLSPLAPRWQAFGWDVAEVDGHDTASLEAYLRAAPKRSGQPHVFLARTVCGKGVDYMEAKLKWHYWPMSDGEYADARAQVEASE